MTQDLKTQPNRIDVAVIGAGIGGLAAALQLAHAGRRVDVFEAHAQVGGKIRTLPTDAGPVDAGPTVLTMRPVFEALFARVGARLEDHVTLKRQKLLARHFWPDGRKLDLCDNPKANAAAIADVFGNKSADEFRIFERDTKRLFERFEAPMMRASRPSLWRMSKVVMCNPTLIAAMAPHQSMAQSLARRFSEPQLAQLFGRYATYVGGAPSRAPALLQLIWQAEAGGVWQAEGGMHALAKALQSLAEAKGVQFHFNAPAKAITTSDGQIHQLHANDQSYEPRAIIFNGDPAALRTGFLGQDMTRAVGKAATQSRSHSANVLSFAATASGHDLALHNVFFSGDPVSEFDDLARHKTPSDPSLYIYAQDRGGTQMPSGPERFEIIMNAPPNGETYIGNPETCKTQTFSTLKAMGLTLSPQGTVHLSTPATYNQLFPGSGGALYGRSPQGMMSAFQRPTARSAISGLYLAGGGCHPGAGVPMATLSGTHAAEAILSDQILTSMSRQTDTHGGTSTDSATTAPMPSR